MKGSERRKSNENLLTVITTGDTRNTGGVLEVQAAFSDGRN